MKSSWLFREGRKRSKVLVGACSLEHPGLLLRFLTGESGAVEESMKELAAVEALKVEKNEKEVSIVFQSWG